MSGSDDRRIAGILCTYRRPRHAIGYLDTLMQQSRRPTVIVVVDNDSSSEIRTACQALDTEIDVRYVDPGSNIGPAGAFHRGFRELAGTLEPDDLLVHFDDDDPPVAHDQLARVVARAHEQMQIDDRVGGVGLSGGRLSPWTGFIRSTVGLAPVEDVDHLHGGYLPVYKAAALLDVGGNDPSFFYGFEELELGRRLHLRGWRLLVDNELMGELRPHYPKRQPRTSNRLAIAEADLGWSRFHKERNLIRVLRRERRWIAILVTYLTRHLGKPLLALARQPRAAAIRLRLGWHATCAGLANEQGIDPRYPPPR